MSNFLKLFSSAALAEILGLFFMNPEEEFYQSIIVKRSGKALMQVQRNLKRLEEAGLITSERKGHMIYYKADRMHPAFEDLKSIFLKTILVGDYLKEALQAFEKKINFAFIYGSVASHKENVGSDIDLFIIGELAMRELSNVIVPFSKKIKREMNVMIFRDKEFKERVAKKENFFVEVIKKPKIWLIGGQNGFKNFIG
ncbi:MAG: hypothetical protein HN411_00660 [Waddliaceae bacterium]|jgi:predicted nucleotidyltransferase|nr:hypothetical protein [Waddliaceae bacterium]MBT3579495.1 hypothetical protein [Waddliaceae bacterium]MBT4444648.1 hypothetical protein [Waddliaceae bacterium]MBT6929213.1 hypothetical protein [Waddliaceae bacterium]